MPGQEKPMAVQIKRKADGWIVMDEKGLHHFPTKEEAEAHAGVITSPPAAPKPKEEAEEE